MQKQIKVGDKVRSLVDELDLRKGAVYEVYEVEGEGKVVVLDDVDDDHGLYADEYEIVPEVVEFQAGDIVTPNAACTSQDTFTPGLEYVVTRVAGNTIFLESDDEGNTRRFRQSEEFDLVRRPSEQPAAVFVITGPRGLLTTEYATRESAEEFLKAEGDNGKDFRIFQEVARYRVNRTAALETI